MCIERNFATRPVAFQTDTLFFFWCKAKGGVQLILESGELTCRLIPTLEAMWTLVHECTRHKVERHIPMLAGGAWPVIGCPRIAAAHQSVKSFNR